MTKTCHKPVLLNQVLDYFSPQKGQYFIDCTLGGGGYSLKISSRIGAAGKIMGIELDGEARERVDELKKEKGINNLIIQAGNFRDLEKLVYMQRYFVRLIADALLEMNETLDLEVRGDDIMIGEGKLSVSIATCSVTSGLIHIGLNANATKCPEGVVMATLYRAFESTSEEGFAKSLDMFDFSLRTKIKAELQDILVATSKVKGLY
jgi:hypothetical protein